MNPVASTSLRAGNCRLTTTGIEDTTRKKEDIAVTTKMATKYNIQSEKLLVRPSQLQKEHVF